MKTIKVKSLDMAMRHETDGWFLYLIARGDEDIVLKFRPRMWAIFLWEKGFQYLRWFFDNKFTG